MSLGSGNLALSFLQVSKAKRCIFFPLSTTQYERPLTLICVTKPVKVHFETIPRLRTSGVVIVAVFDVVVAIAEKKTRMRITNYINGYPGREQLEFSVFTSGSNTKLI